MFAPARCCKMAPSRGASWNRPLLDESRHNFLPTGGGVYRLLAIIMVSCHCWAQMNAPMPGQTGLRGLLDDSDMAGTLHGCHFGKDSFQLICSVDPYTKAPREAPVQERPTGEKVSVKQLRHKISKEAARAFQRGIALSMAGKHEEAATELEAAVRRDPELSSAEDQLGLEYVYLGRWKEAETAFRRAIDLEPASWMPHYNLALTLYGAGDGHGAEESMRRALQLSNENPRIHLVLGEMLIQREETRTEGISELNFAART